MEIRGVPESVDWSVVEAFLTSLGIDVNEVQLGSGGVVIGWDSIRCTVVARDLDGRLMLDAATEELATHEVHIPVVRAESVSG